MCFSAADGNSDGTCAFLFGVTKRVGSVAPTLLSVRTLLLAKNICTDRSVGATQVYFCRLPGEGNSTIPTLPSLSN
jgi:hypothetical protein